MASSVCDGIGPTAPASLYGVVQFGVMLFVVIFMLATAALTVYQRQFRRRLRIRSVLPLVYGSTIGAGFILVRIVFDLIGIEYFPCTLNVLLYYMLPVINFAPDLASIAVFLSKQARRQHLNAKLIQAMNNLQADDRGHHNEDSKRWATVAEYFAGLWNYLVELLEVVWCFSGSPTARYASRLGSGRKVSFAREMSYEMFTIFLLTIPHILTGIVRIITFPPYHPAAGCMGCMLNWDDFIIMFVVTVVSGVPFTVMMFKARMKQVPDPLAYINDSMVATTIIFPMVVASAALFSSDPGGLMRSQQVDWMILEMAAIFYIHLVRTVVQLYRTRRMHKLNEAQVKLIDILFDAQGSLLFEKHLIAELANENLLFWREAIKYKLQFDKNRDLEMSQQVARVIYRTFISPSAALPINISGELRHSIDTKFKGVVGRGVFDDALVEVYYMMQNGAFRRFIQSEAFKQYSNVRADFSMSTVFDSMAIVPSVSYGSDAESSTTSRRQVDIKQYIQSL